MAMNLKPASAEDVSTSTLPIIDFGEWISSTTTESRRRAMAQQLVNACHETGFVYIINHGISSPLLKEAFTWSKQFFDLPTEKKMQARHLEGSTSFRGYLWPGREKISNLTPEEIRDGAHEQDEGLIDFTEAYDVGSDNDKVDINIWLPEATLPGLRTFLTTFYDECWKLSQEVLQALSLGLGLSDEFLLKYHSADLNELSLRHYPPVAASKIESTAMERLHAHTDFDSLTLLFQDDCGGLEVQSQRRQGEFVHADPIEGALVMNIGDVLMRWSNDHLLSTMHRVHLPPLQDRYTGQERMTRSRYSIPYFVVPARDSIMECLPVCCSEDNPPKYAPMSYREYYDMRANEVFS